MKKKVLILFLGLILLNGVLSQDMTVADIQNMMRDQLTLDSLKETINQALDSVPEQIIGLIGTNRVYHGRLGSTSLTIVLENGQVTQLRRGAPNNPTHTIYASMNTVLTIANADDPASAAMDAVLQGSIVITTAPQCSENLACDDNQVCVNGQCQDAFTIAVVPIAYDSGEYQEFYDKAQPEMSLVEEHIPMNTNYLRIHYVNPNTCPNMQCTDVCRDCQNTAVECARRAGLVSVADKVVGISKDDVATYFNGNQLLLCGCAGGIPAYSSVSRSRLYVNEGVYCYMTVVHELGHQMGLYHVDAIGTEGGACQGPNAADCQEPDKASDIMGYGWPQDHFGPAATNYLTSSVLGDYQ